jgi:hypothetical protein
MRLPANLHYLHSKGTPESSNTTYYFSILLAFRNQPQQLFKRKSKIFKIKAWLACICFVGQRIFHGVDKALIDIIQL